MTGTKTGLKLAVEDKIFQIIQYVPTELFQPYHVRMDEEQRDELPANPDVSEDEADLFMINVKANALLQVASFAGKVGQVPVKIIYKGLGNMLEFR